jgi:hypothetical protein
MGVGAGTVNQQWEADYSTKGRGTEIGSSDSDGFDAGMKSWSTLYHHSIPREWSNHVNGTLWGE